MEPNRVTENDLVPPDWMDGDNEATVEEWGQREYESGRKNGNGDGIARAALWLMKKATESFENGDMEKAATLRDHSLSIIEELKP